MKDSTVNLNLLFERLPIALNGASILILLYVVILIVATPFYLSRTNAPAGAKDSWKNASPNSLKEASAYASIFASHPLFGTVAQPVAQAVKSVCDEFKNRFTLTGIVSGEHNEAILSDRSSRETRFAKAGDSLDGASVVEVKPHSLVLDCSGKQLEVGIEGS